MLSIRRWACAHVLANLRSISLCAVLVAGLGVLGLAPPPAQGQDTGTTYDQEFLPIKALALRQELHQSNRDAVRLYDLIRRADTQHQMRLAFDVMNQMRLKEPDNAVVLSGYCLAFQMALGDYGMPNQKSLSLTDDDRKNYLRTLQKAYNLNPNLWLPYAVEGHALMASPYEDRKAIRLLKMAERLAPDVSYTHTLLAEAYTVYGTPYHSFRAAAEECEIARHLQPISVKNADILFDIYDIRLPDLDKARDAKQYLLSTLPPKYQFQVGMQERLAKY